MNVTTSYSLGRYILRKVARLGAVSDDVLARLDAFEGTEDDVRMVADVLFAHGFVDDAEFVRGRLDTVLDIARAAGDA